MSIGAICMLRALQEALRIRRDSWKMWENYRQVVQIEP
jgi:hypothetical protein